MIASRLLADLEAAGIELSRNGEQLHYRARPGVRIAPFRDVISAHKLELLAALDWHAAVTVRGRFDRAHVNALYARLVALEKSALREQ